MEKPPILRVLRILSQQERTTMLGRLGEKLDSFKVLIATILSARAKDEVTELIAQELFKKYPDCNSLATAKPSDVKKIIKRIGFYNTKTKNIMAAAAMVRDQFNGQVPQTYEQLMQLPGVGRKVAGCVLVYSFDQDAIPVDTHVHRISNRLGWVRTKTPEKTEEVLRKIIPRAQWMIVNDTLVHHGKTICAPISPFCSKCPVEQYCKKVGVTTKR